PHWPAPALAVVAALVSSSWSESSRSLSLRQSAHADGDAFTPGDGTIPSANPAVFCSCLELTCGPCGRLLHTNPCVGWAPLGREKAIGNRAITTRSHAGRMCS